MQIEDNITQEYRAGATKVVPPKKAVPKAPSAGKSKPVLNCNEISQMAEAITYQCNEISQMKIEMSQMADHIAKVTRPWFLCFLVCSKFEKTHVFIYIFLVFIAESVGDIE